MNIYIATYLHTVYLDWVQAVFERNLRKVWKWRLSKLRDTLRGRDWVSLERYFGGRDRVTLEIQWETVIERLWRCTWRPRSGEFRDTVEGCDQASFEMRLEAVIELLWRCTWRLWSCELGCRIRASLEIQLEALNERVRTSTGSQSIDGVPSTETLFVCLLTRNHENGTRWLSLQALTERHTWSYSNNQGSTHNRENEEKTNNLGWMLYSVYVILDVCYTRC
jgi:hypothetical protein